MIIGARQGGLCRQQAGSTQPVGSAELTAMSLVKAGPASLGFTSVMTVECWLKYSTLGSGSELWTARRWDATQLHFKQYYDHNYAAAKYMFLAISKDGSTSKIVGNSTLTPFVPADTWVHFASVFSAADNRVWQFKNGVVIGTGGAAEGTGVNLFGASTSSFIVGNDTNGQVWRVAHVRLWNKKRVAADILADYQTVLGGDEADLVGYWPLGGDLNDRTANANHLTTSGAGSLDWQAADAPF